MVDDQSSNFEFLLTGEYKYTVKLLLSLFVYPPLASVVTDTYGINRVHRKLTGHLICTLPLPKYL
jgi:hypothetical protein